MLNLRPHLLNIQYTSRFVRLFAAPRSCLDYLSLQLPKTVPVEVQDFVFCIMANLTSVKLQKWEHEVNSSYGSVLIIERDCNTSSVRGT